MESFSRRLDEVHDRRAVLVDEALASYEHGNWVDRIYVMQYTTLGRTGLKVSVAGLGCGGFSRLGLGTGRSEAEAVALVRQAHDLGANLFDTAATYGTESVVGQAIKSVPRESVVSATKAWVPPGESRSAADRA